MLAYSLPLLFASAKMTLRSRGVIFAVLASSLQIAVLGLLPNLDFGIDNQQISFFDFALPGIAVFLVVYQIQDITVAVAASYRARGILKRLAVTPVSPVLLILAQAISYVVLGVAAAGMVLAIGRLIGGNLAMTWNLLWLAPLIAIIILTSLAIAFTVAGLTSNPQTASNAGQTITFFMFAFTGAMLPIEALPDPLPEIVLYTVPHTALIQAIRGIALTGTNISAYTRQILIGAVWLVAALISAAFAYRFTED